MKKIAFVVPWYGDKIPGGAETETRNIVKNLTKKGIEVEILTTWVEKFSSDWNKNYYKEGNYEESGIKIKRFKVRKRDNKKFDNTGEIKGNNVTLTTTNDIDLVGKLHGAQSLTISGKNIINNGETTRTGTTTITASNNFTICDGFKCSMTCDENIPPKFRLSLSYK